MSKKKKQKNKAKVIIPLGHPNPPEQHEIDAAMILASHYNTKVEFIVPVDDYLRKSADLIMSGVEWEMKSPIGYSKATIENQFRRASKQSKNMVIDTRRTKLDDKDIEKAILRETKKPSAIKRVILINKFGEIVVIPI